MNRYLQLLKTNSFFYPILIGLILITGFAVRVVKFPEIPPGLNVDEAVSAYEAYALLETGNDKWGHPWPAYFPGWGSGQNVLLAYLTIPFLKFFGLNILSARLAMLVFGLLTLPLFYFCLRPLGRFPAVVGLLLVCLVPWHFMLSRWALESNLVPFFTLLGCTFLSRALISDKKRWIIPSLVPFALALYAYGTTVMVLPLLFGLTFLFYFRQIKHQWLAWFVALALFLVVAFPFLIFFIENHLLKTNLGFTDNFFFSTPLLPSNRLHQINSGGWTDTIQKNFDFLKASFNDQSNYNLMPGFKLLLPITVPLAIIGLFVGLFISFKNFRKKSSAGNQEFQPAISVFWFWALASLTLFFSFELNVNRFNHFYLPLIALVAWLLHLIISKIYNYRLRTGLQVLVIIWIVAESSFAIRHYFTDYPKTDIQVGFNAGLQEAFEAVQKLPVEQVRLTDYIQLRLTYIYALFYLKYPPAEFQQHGDFTIENGMYKVNRFGKYIFYDEFVNNNKPCGFLFRKGEFKNDSIMHREIVYENEFWEVGIMKPASQLISQPQTAGK